MSTRSVIAAELPGGDIRGTYVHHDGYPEHMAVQIDKLIAEHGAEAALTALPAPITGWSSVDTTPSEYGARSGHREVPSMGWAYQDNDGDGRGNRLGWDQVAAGYHEFIYIISPADETPLKVYTWEDRAYDDTAILRRVMPGKNGWDTPVLTIQEREAASLSEQVEALAREANRGPLTDTELIALAARERELCDRGAEKVQRADVTYYSLTVTGTRDGREEHYADYTVDGSTRLVTDPYALLDDAEMASLEQSGVVPNLKVERGPTWLRVSYTLDGEHDDIEKVDEYVVRECSAFEGAGETVYDHDTREDFRLGDEDELLTDLRDTLADRCGEEAADRLIAARLHSNRVARSLDHNGDEAWRRSGQEQAILGQALDQHQHGQGIGL